MFTGDNHGYAVHLQPFIQSFGSSQLSYWINLINLFVASPYYYTMHQKHKIMCHSETLQKLKSDGAAWEKIATNKLKWHYKYIYKYMYTYVYIYVYNMSFLWWLWLMKLNNFQLYILTVRHIYLYYVLYLIRAITSIILIE